MGFRDLALLPARAAAYPAKALLLPRGPTPTDFSLPVAGLDEATAQALVTKIREASGEGEGEGSVAPGGELSASGAWLLALATAESLLLRLAGEAEQARRHATFWAARERPGRRRIYAWLERGPGGLGRRSAWVLRAQLRRARSTLTRDQRPARAAAAVVDPCGARAVEARTALARARLEALLLALARTQRAGAQLRLAASGRAVRDGVEEAMGEVLATLDDLSRAEDGLLQRAEPAPEPAVSPATLRRAGARSREALADGLRRARTAAEGAWLAVSAKASEHSRSWERGLRDGGTGGGGPEVAAAAAGAPPTTPLPTPDVPLPLSRYPRLLEATRRINLLPTAAEAAYAAAAVPASAREALEVGKKAARAARAGALAGKGALLAPPAWGVPPGPLRRHWLRAAATWGLAGAGAFFLYRHSSLAGSPDLGDWTRSSVRSARGVWDEHVATPLRAVTDELFNTFRSRPGMVSLDEYRDDRESLARMLAEFESDWGVAPPAPGGPEADPPAAPAAGGAGTADPALPLPPAPLESTDDGEISSGLRTLMLAYESELRRPLRNFVTGNLARCLLIQVQKMKVDTESAMLELDQILRANELTMTLLAAVPSILIVGAGIYAASRAASPNPPDPRAAALPARLSLQRLEVAIARARDEQEAADAGRGEIRGEAATPLAPGPSSLATSGQVAFALLEAHATAGAAFSRRGLFAWTSTRGEWETLRGDLTGLASPALDGSWEGGWAQKQVAARRIARSYSLYNQF